MARFARLFETAGFGPPGKPTKEAKRDDQPTFDGSPKMSERVNRGQPALLGFGKPLPPACPAAAGSP